MGSITLNWTDNNTTETGHKVYRSESPMDPDNLPEPLATLGANVTTYKDEDIVDGETYYYRTSALRGLSEAVSDEIMVEAIAGNLLVAPSGLVLELIDGGGEEPAPDLPTVIGEAFGGGYYAGDIKYPDGQWYKLIVADVSADITGNDSRWKTEQSITVGTGSLTDGVANTNAMIAAGIELHPAANYCVNHTGGGNSDWYMPAKDEFNVIYLNLGNQVTTVEFFKIGGGQEFTNGFYYTSTGVGTGSVLVWLQNPFDGRQLTSNTNDARNRVRPIRRIAFTPPAVQEPIPTTIGEQIGGGFYIGDITVADGGADDGVYAVIMTGVAGQAQHSWKTERSTTVGTASLTNGLANTLAMQADDPAIHPAGMYCLNYTGGDHDDWYLPAKDELNLAWVNRANLAELAMEAQYYGSSTGNSSTHGWIQYFANGNPISYEKDFQFQVRPVRRIKKS